MFLTVAFVVSMPQPHDKILKIKQSLTSVVALLQLQLLDFVAIKLFGKLGHMEKNSSKLSKRFRDLSYNEQQSAHKSKILVQPVFGYRYYMGLVFYLCISAITSTVC